MSAYNGLPEITLSKKCAKYLLTRNAGEKALFRKESFLIEKAKTKQEKAFRRERELLIHRECRNRELIQATQLYGRTSVTLKKISRSNEGESDWEIKSDTSYARQRKKTRSFVQQKSISGFIAVLYFFQLHESGRWARDWGASHLGTFQIIELCTSSDLANSINFMKKVKDSRTRCG